ncbi:alpha/beta fold hydrolase [Antricoccus suffuscus]|uniref:alpha/beta fold hydrolase n=1 Tax=Antricoccus suffuscus TaxID=1629062 RepID=UPI00192E282B|nr:alpha/beta fold hydrolase [Antricoccus suffuscus]
MIVVAGGLVSWRLISNANPGYRTVNSMFGSNTSPSVLLDTTMYIPDNATAAHPAPAVIVAHGFGGDKESVAADAKDLAARGYVVLAYSARGFGKSDGQISLNAPDAEVADAKNLITMLAQQPEVQKDGPNDPRVGIVGASYGGALALMTAGLDDRVDAIVPEITWNRLSRVFFPNGSGVLPHNALAPAAVGPGAQDVAPGVFKREWAGIFFGLGKGNGIPSLLPSATSGDSSDSSGSGGSGAASKPGASDGTFPLNPALEPQLVCGKFSAQICQVYTEAASTGTLSAASVAVLDKSSPYSVADKIKAPTFLIQGQNDSLFPLSEADETARQIALNGTDVKVYWTAGGHDAGGVGATDDETKQIRGEVAGWFDHYLKKTGPKPSLDFAFDQETGLSVRGGRPAIRVERAPSYPGVHDLDVATKSLTVSGTPQLAVAPAGGVPSSISTLPGIGNFGLAYDPPGQAAVFTSKKLTTAMSIVGSSSIKIHVSGVPEGAVLFAKLYDVPDGGTPSLPGGSVAPVVVPPSAPGAGVDVDVVLPAVAHQFETGHRLLVAFATTDRSYQSEPQQKVIGISLAGGSGGLTYATVSATPDAAPVSDWLILLAIVVGAGVLAALVSLLWRRRRLRKEYVAFDTQLADVPLVADGLRKAYKDGFVAVRSVNFRVERGQVVGLLGPNGAGKTTALRMLMGLIRPTAGELRVFGHHISPGSPVLSRLGCFVEGVGFLQHLNGRDNIELFWAATGRPLEDARLDEVLEIAGLGDAIDRKVKTYSQGMRQRLAIAQAMLGLPDLLVLDEPTNGLDPPQIAEMRAVLRSYARDGRSVLISSHQLAEVEQTCSHIVVINKGEVIASGSVAEVVGVGAELTVGVDDPAIAARLIDRLDGVIVIDQSATEIGVEITDEHVHAADIVAALVTAGVRVDSAVPRRHLEDAFLALVGEVK